MPLTAPERLSALHTIYADVGRKPAHGELENLCAITAGSSPEEQVRFDAQVGPYLRPRIVQTDQLHELPTMSAEAHSDHVAALSNN